MIKEGLILKGIGGFYYVETADGVFECKAKGKFRKERISPLAGDRVIITVRDDNKENGAALGLDNRAQKGAKANWSYSAPSAKHFFYHTKISLSMQGKSKKPWTVFLFRGTIFLSVK